jgi:hypothetical protein
MRTKNSTRYGARFAAAVLLFALAACADAPIAEPDPIHARQAKLGAQLVECPVSVTRSTSGLIGPLGGSLTLDGHSITFPEGAVVVPTTFTLAAPAGNYMELDIRANGAEHFEFETPVTVTISYARCTRADIDKAPLSVWYIDSTTKHLLENMGGTDNKVARTVTFGTGHLSSYSIAQ